MTPLSIEEVGLNHLDRLQQISQQTFSETFAESNTAADMQSYLTTAFSEEKLTAELQTGYSDFYFATASGNVIGYLKLNVGPSQTEQKLENSLEIERIYVLKAYHGQRVGQLLYDKAMEVARQKNVDYVWLGVWEKNPRAISFYRKNGFVEFDRHMFRLGDDEQTDILMKLDLKHKAD